LIVICTLAVAGAGVGAGVTAVGVDGAVGDVLFEHATLARMATQTTASIPHVMLLIDILSPSKTDRIENG
jgi:hypothetical protein